MLSFQVRLVEVEKPDKPERKLFRFEFEETPNEKIIYSVSLSIKNALKALKKKKELKRSTVS